MDRRNFYFKQRVTAAELEVATQDGPEQALWNLANDTGIFGIIAGGVVTQHDPVNMTVDVVGPFTGYDQAGARVHAASTEVKSCTTDYDGNPTVPTVPGESRWISILARFARYEDDQRIDGNGDTVYWVDNEYHEYRIISGTAAVSPVRPAKPSDAILVCDILLTYGQTTVLNADIYFDRADDFTWAAAVNVTVDNSAWTRILGSPVNLQAALDAIDEAVVLRDGSRFVAEAFVPDGNGTRALGGSGAGWSAYVASIAITSGGSGVTTDWLPDATGSRKLGSSSKEWSEVRGFNLYASVAAYIESCQPVADQDALGAPATRWNAHLYDTVIYNSFLPSAVHVPLGDTGSEFDAFLAEVVVANYVHPKVDQLPLGSTTERWNANLYNAVVYNSVIPDADLGADCGGSSANWRYVYGKFYRLPNDGTFRYQTTRTVSRVINPANHGFVETTWVGQIRRSIGGRTIVGIGVNHATPDKAWISLDVVPEGATFAGLTFSWYQASGTAALTASVIRVTNTGTNAVIGTPLTIGASGAWRDHVDTYNFGGGFSQDKATYTWGIEIDGAPASVQCAVAGIAVSWSLTDITDAACYN